MIYPNKSKLHYKLLTWYVNRILKKDFERINIFGEAPSGDESILLIANHSTWWDGFWMMHLNNTLLKKEFYVLMLEDELSKRRFFTKVGAFSINPNQGKIKDSLQFSRKILSEKNNLLLFFPEGKFSPSSQNKKEFNRGVSFFYKNRVSFKTLFVVSLTDYFEYRKPQLNIYIKENKFDSNASHQDIENQYNLFAKNCIEKQKQLAK